MSTLYRVLMSSSLGALYAYLYYTIVPRGPTALAILAATVLIIGPIVVAVLVPRSKWWDILLSLAVAWGVMLIVTVTVWKDAM